MSQIKIGVIYIYTSPSGKVYIGQTINERSRKSQHKTDTIKSNTYFGKALRKYGWDNFKYETIIKFSPTIDKEKLKRVLNKLEKRYIKLYKSDEKEFGYNLNNGGDGNLGYMHTEETIQILKNVPKTKEQLLNLEKGRVGHKEETILKMSIAQNSKKKRVGKFDILTDELLQEYNSIADAAKDIKDSTATQKTKSSRIGECCNEKRKSIFGYSWKFI